MVEKNSKRLANLSLLVASTGFVATMPFQAKFIQILSGGFEAALVGGLADWFAVTAMFRHPLNIPIPHTALLPKNRAKITEGILSSLNNQWLSKESLIEKVNEQKWIEKGVDSFENMLNDEESKEKIISSIQEFGSSIQKKSIEKIIQDSLHTTLKSISSEKIWSNVIDKIFQNEWDEKTYEFLIDKIEDYVKMPHIKELIGREIIQFIERKFFMIKAFLPMIGEEKIIEFIHNGLLDLLIELKNPESDRRKTILSFIRIEAEKSKTNENVIRQLDEWKNSGATYAIQEVTNWIQNKLADRTYILNTLLRLLDFIKKSGWVDKIDITFKKILYQLIEKYHYKIGELVRMNIEKLSTEEITDLLENKIGKDITWIRVNGAVCGFLIGIILSTIQIIFK
ncbi:DUF445 domain-containing protein [Gottfriedia solisilvae]|uniref:DUF445 domain-containing protein n=1 Tax=Gottfriedia solisilvae TaxID=1516104 RepID=UPI003D2EFA11